MKRTFLMLIAAGSLYAAGCIPLIHPVYSDAELVFEPALVGSFAPGDGTWNFAQRDDRSYVLTVTENGEKSTHYEVHLARVGELLLMDLYPEPSDAKVDEYLGTLLMPLHTFALVETIEPDLVLRTLNMQFVEKLLKENPGALKHEVEKDNLIITASTGEIQAFVTKYATIADAWEETVLAREK